MRRVHPLGRLSFALGMLATVLLIQRDAPAMFTLLAACMVLISWLSASWLPVWRAARLLLWLVLPVLLLHLMFTPGQLLWPGSGISFSREGLQEGIRLGLRLSAMFYAAMLFSRCLSREEWVWYCLRLPVFGALLLPYVKLSSPMRGVAGRALADASVQINLQAGWGSASHVLRALGDAIAIVWHASGKEAEQVWLHWHDEAAARRATGSVAAGVLLAMLGLLMPLSVWLAG